MIFIGIRVQLNVTTLTDFQFTIFALNKNVIIFTDLTYLIVNNAVLTESFL
jgi:hypothetical protein